MEQELNFLKMDYMKDTNRLIKPMGQYKLSELMPMINQIAKENELKPSRLNDFNIIIKLISIRYFNNHGCFNSI